MNCASLINHTIIP